MANENLLTIDPSLLLGTPKPPRAQPVTVQDLTPFLSQGQQQPQPPAVTTGPATLDINAPIVTSLANSRSSFAQELQNPENRRLLIASIRAEVGDQGTNARLGYAESVMNRALASNRSIQNTVIDPYRRDPTTGKMIGYYPQSTMRQLNDPVSDKEYALYSPIIDKALGGSNISNLATGNESGRLHSMPVTYDPGSGERFVDEKPYSDWRSQTQRALSNQPTQPVQQSPPAQQSYQTQGNSPTMDLTRFLSSG
jgi:hypothetical protein